MTDWNDLGIELDRWAAARRNATFWWRDDDAGPDDGKLDGFLAQRRDLDVPLALAVVPAWLETATTEAILADDGASVLQHGVSHTNRAGPDQRKTELCDSALEGGLADAIATAGRTLQAAFGTRFHTVMVPPWNRIDPQVAASLSGLGLSGLSTLAPREISRQLGLSIANLHLDIINWRADRQFGGDAWCLDQAIYHLVQRRTGISDPTEPTGLMTHHRVHDVDSCRFIDKFVSFVHEHPAAHWLDASEVFCST